MGPQSKRRVLAAVSLERLMGAITAQTVCVADAERRAALEHGVSAPARLRVVYNGSPECQDGLEPDPELKAFAQGGPLAACLTVLRPQKAVEVFVKAAPAILAAVPQARLAVIGEGDTRPELERLALEMAIGDRLAFFDFRPPAARQLASIDVFVLPSSWEAFPISILEALACGVPQVATDVGGNAEAVAEGQTGLLCPPSDPDGLAAAVIELLRDDARRERMAEASVERHRTRFRLDAMVDGIVDVYEHAARRPTAAEGAS
jgi:glycosyltransferase involved in cell wall biosynthesis